MKKRKSYTDILKSIIIFIFFASCVLYLCIALFNISSYLMNFIHLQYTNTQDLPSFSDVFNSVFSVINILVTSCLSYLIYKLTKKQGYDLHNYNIASSASIFLRSFESCITNAIIHEYNKYRKESLKLKPVVTLDDKEIFIHMSKVIGYLEDDRVKDGLYNLYFIMRSDASILSLINKDLLDKSEEIMTDQDLYSSLEKTVHSDKNQDKKFFYVESELHRNALNELYNLSKFKS